MGVPEEVWPRVSTMPEIALKVEPAVKKGHSPKSVNLADVMEPSESCGIGSLGC